jgi:RNA polymerase sigma factor (sigma-70 family)
MELAYGDLFEEWETTIARRTVAQFQVNYPWLRDLGFNDLLQECLTHLYFNRGSFQEGKGASVKTYMARVLNHKLHSILRQQLSDKRKIDHMAERLEKPLGESERTLSDVIPSDDIHLDIPLRLDIESALGELTPLQKEICVLLSQDYSVMKIAEIVGKPRSTVRDEIKRVRKTFREKGMEDYL